MFTIIYILQVIALWLLFGNTPSYLWWSLLGVFIVLYFAGKTYKHGITSDDEPRVVSFWYKARSVVFIIDILLILGIFGYIIFL